MKKNTFKEVKSMKVTLFPKTRLGKWSLAFIITLIMFFTFFLVMVNFLNQRGGETFFSNLYLTIPMLLSWLSGFLAFLTGVCAIAKSKARSIFVFLTTFIGFLITLYGFTEVIFTH